MNDQIIERRRNLWEFLTICRGDRLTYRQIQKALDYATANTVWHDLRALEAAGYIVRVTSVRPNYHKVIIPFISREITTW